MRFIKLPYHNTSLLLRLLLIMVIVLGLKSSLRADVISHPSHLQAHLQTDVIKNAFDKNDDSATDKSFHKTRHIRSRYKTVKDSFRKATEPSAIFYADIKSVRYNATDIRVATVLKPGYYLFLFRLNPF